LTLSIALPQPSFSAQSAAVSAADSNSRLPLYQITGSEVPSISTSGIGRLGAQLLARPTRMVAATAATPATRFARSQARRSAMKPPLE